MLDMGPYYVTALVSLLGQVRRVAGSSSMPRAERLITSEPLKGTQIKVETPTHLAGLLDFDSGVTATLVTSFDVWHHQHSNIEIYGTEGSLLVPDPNTFGGPVKLRRYDEEQWREMPLTHAWAQNSRGLGVADLASAVRDKREARAGAAMAEHVLEVMLAFEASSIAGRHLEMKTHCARPEALPPASFGGVPA
jgi:predicted dehydrogenase